MRTPPNHASFECLEWIALDCAQNSILTLFIFRAKKITSNHAPLVPVLEPALSAKEPSPPREGRSPSPDTLLLTHSGPNVPPGTTTIQSEQRSRLAAELSRVHEEPEHEEAIVRSQRTSLPSFRPHYKRRSLRSTSLIPRLDLQTAMSNTDPGETSLALLHSLKNETARRVQPARYRPVGASDATTEGVDSSIIESSRKGPHSTTIIPPGTKFLLYNGPAKEGEQDVKWELSAGQRAGIIVRRWRRTWRGYAATDIGRLKGGMPVRRVETMRLRMNRANC